MPTFVSHLKHTKKMESKIEKLNQKAINIIFSLEGKKKKSCFLTAEKKIKNICEKLFNEFGVYHDVTINKCVMTGDIELRVSFTKTYAIKEFGRFQKIYLHR